MIIGVMSDSHDNLPLVEKAVALFVRRGVEHILHAGDIVAPFSLMPIIESGIPFQGVLGNNDGEVPLLLERSKGAIQPAPRRLVVDDKQILLQHFHHFVEEIALSGKFDVVVYGHTHEVDNRVLGKTLLLNPGECCGLLTGKPSVALLDTDAIEAEIVYL
jgi:putative phosphoesterase